jgi:hypothetical protein
MQPAAGRNNLVAIFFAFGHGIKLPMSTSPIRRSTAVPATSRR